MRARRINDPEVWSGVPISVHHMDASMPPEGWSLCLKTKPGELLCRGFAHTLPWTAVEPTGSSSWNDGGEFEGKPCPYRQNWHIWPQPQRPVNSCPQSGMTNKDEERQPMVAASQWLTTTISYWLLIYLILFVDVHIKEDVKTLTKHA